MRSLCALALVIPVLVAQAAPKPGAPVQTFTIHGPTVIGLCAPADPKHADDDAAVDDFSWYASQSAKRLKAAGVEFVTTSKLSFHVNVDRHTLAFIAKDIGCGYYLIAPGMKPHVEYGVMTDDDLMSVAAKTFHTSQK